jgi:hypothetical protein
VNSYLIPKETLEMVWNQEQAKWELT